MIEKIIEFSAKNRFLVFTLIAILAISGWYSMRAIPIDAIPDLSETQVIIYSKWDRSPDIIEDQVTYPIINALLGAPKIKDIRGFSDFGFSYVYVIFEDGTDPYWARSRTLEYLSKISSQLPTGVQTELGPDATGIGWVFQYALTSEDGTKSLADLRSYQDWFLRYILQSAPGVSEVAAIGGFQKQYQVKVNPNALLAYKIPLTKVADAIRAANNDVGARLLEISGAEYMIRGRGYIKKVSDIQNIVVGHENGTPIYIKNLATVSIGSQMRRGVSDLDGRGDAVGGTVIMRYGENAPHVIEGVKKRLDDIKPSMPKGINLVVTYDRSDLIKRAIATLTHELFLEMFIVSIIIIIFLRHFPSAMIPVITLPLAVLISFIPMKLFGISSNIMSLGGIAIAIGAMVDAAIVVVENTHKHLEIWERDEKKDPIYHVIVSSIKEVGPASFYSLLVIAVSFIPIFALEAQEGKLFKPLAYTKNLSMIVAALLAITLDPALRITLTAFQNKTFKPAWLCNFRNRILVGKIEQEEKQPLSKFFFKYYGPVVDWSVNHRYKVIIISILAMLITIPIYFKIGSEFMPPLNEGSLLYMPTTMPGISVTQAHDLLKRQDEILKSFPEVATVFGKAGRVDSSTDPAPFSMMETTIILKPHSEWRDKKSWYSWLIPQKISWEELVSEMDSKTKFPGTTNAWTMPIRNRIDMLTTGIRTPVGIKVQGSDLKEVEKIAVNIEGALHDVKGVRSVFAERIGGGYFLDFNFDREKLARFGISMQEAQETLSFAVGGENITKTIEGRERYSINLRYLYDYRSNLDALKRVLIPAANNTQIPMGQVATLSITHGPSMIRNENGLLTGYVYIDLDQSDIGSFVERAKKIVAEKVVLPSSVSLRWSGQYENMERVKEKLKVIIPITLFIIILLLYLNTKSWSKTSIILLAVPFSAIGAIWLLYLLGFNMSIAVWVGLIALLGVDAETGIFMLLYLDLAFNKRKESGLLNSFSDLKEAIHEGAVKRIRPKVMTAITLLIALLPIMLMGSHNAGADVMKRIAAPMFGGITSSFLLELIVYPAIFAIWKSKKERLV